MHAGLRRHDGEGIAGGSLSMAAGIDQRKLTRPVCPSCGQRPLSVAVAVDTVPLAWMPCRGEKFGMVPALDPCFSAIESDSGLTRGQGVWTLEGAAGLLRFVTGSGVHGRPLRHAPGFAWIGTPHLAPELRS